MGVVERDAGGGYGGSVKIKGMGEAGAQEGGAYRESWVYDFDAFGCAE